jgi:hypothetical protein
MSGTRIGPDWNGALRLFWSFLWRMVVLSTIASLGLGLICVLLLRLGAITPTGFSKFGNVAVPVIFFAMQIEALRRLAAAYDIRTLGGPAPEQDHRQRR